jgi:hypothetical protein
MKGSIRSGIKAITISAFWKTEAKKKPKETPAKYVTFWINTIKILISFFCEFYEK